MRELQDYYIYAVVFSLGTGLLYAVSLVFSKAGKNLWLRTTGVFILILGAFSVYLLILSLNAMGQSNNTITELNQWITLAVSLLPIPLILLFYSEIKSLKVKAKVSGQNKSSKLFYGFGGIAAVMILVFGIAMGIQSYWKTHISPHTKKLAESFEARIYVNSEEDTLLYRLLKPKDYHPDQQYPLVVCLHGGAGWGIDNYRQFEGSLFARILSKPVNREKYPAFLFVPQCPPGSSWGGIPNLPAIDSLVFETIDSLENEFAIDEDRLYVNGHSLGGYGTWHFIGTRSERFAAALPVAGEGDPDLALNMLDVAIWAFHGANDKNVPVNGSREVIEAIRKTGGDPRYTESPDGGHSWNIVIETPGVLEWLFAQSRDK
jgi:predicted peptidase